MRYFEDFPVGTMMTHQGPTLSEEEIIEFASRYDPQHFHVDRAAAERSHYGGLIASGWHTMATTMRMMCDCYLLEAASLGSPGVDEVRWHLPVRPGDTLAVAIEVTEARRSRSKPDRGLIHYHAQVVNQHSQVVMTFNAIGMLKTRDDCAAG
ncbi:MAG: MaoC family dehydratase [Gammaproteobacteria bacterium]